jgi:hypothetical protein
MAPSRHSKIRRCLGSGEEMTLVDTPVHPAGRSVLCTITGEPFQPARLYYSMPNKAMIIRQLRELDCMDEDREGVRWVWLYQAEVRGLTFGLPYKEIPAEAHPIVIGSFRFPKTGGMVLEVRSFERAIAAARFFGPRLGPRVVLRRARVLNRWFQTSEVNRGLENLDSSLDRNVTVIDQREAERQLEADLASGEFQSQNPRAKKYLPEVEDFPLAPQEETEDFTHLNLTLQLRAVYAHEHWKGNTHLTLRDIIMRLYE